jgi:predicted AAA+ superfamily ATPase
MERDAFLEEIERYFQSHPVVALLGPRQCGKTTLARALCRKIPSFPKSNYFDLESPVDVERLRNPLLALKPLSGLIVIDEIQRMPELFPTLRVLVDEEASNQQYLILGSASPDLIRQSSESLAGRIAYVELTPFSFVETNNLERLWIRGGFPKSYLAQTEEESADWRSFYIRTFLEQDIPNLGIKIPPNSLRRFWTMLAHYHGNIFNASEIGRSFGASDVTMRKYLDILTGTFMIRQLQPWYENISKRQVKSPKIFFRDSGILHSLLHIYSFAELQTNPKIGASWEGFAIEEIIRSSHLRTENCFFWSTYGEAEIDLILQKREGLIGIEVKYTDAPTITKSMRVALKDLSLKHIYVIYPGDVDYPLSENITAKGLKNFLIPSTLY